MTTLDSIVNEVLNEEGAVTQHGYDRYLMIAFRGLEQIRLHIYGQTRSDIFDKDEERECVYMPSDCVKVTKVALYNGTKLIRLNEKGRSLNNVIGKVTYTDNDSPLDFGFLNFQNSQGLPLITGAYYGNPNDLERPGSYSLDEINQVLYFDSKYSADYDRAVVQYISNGDKSSYAVPDACKETLIAWIHWRKIIAQKSVSQGSIQAARKEFYNEWRKCKKVRFGLTGDQVNEIIRSAYMSGVKSPLSDAD